ncbi:MAG: hypothetical protein ABSC19_02180 [Syntrophorhabdales bacterium]
MANDKVYASGGLIAADARFFGFLLFVTPRGPGGSSPVCVLDHVLLEIVQLSFDAGFSICPGVALNPGFGHSLVAGFT